MSQLRKYVLRWVGLLICAASFVQAAPFAKTISFQQPDGTMIELWGQGDEFRAVFETLDGYTVMFDPATKTYFYAAVSADGTQLVSTGLEVGKGNPQALGLAQHVRISAEAARLQTRARFEKWDQGMGVTARWNARKKALRVAESLLADGPVQLSPPDYTTTDQKMGLTLLIDFTDDPATVPRADIVDYCNGDAYTGNGNNGSVKKYFLDNSNGLLIYSNTVTAYIRMVKPKSYYNNTSKDCGTQAREMITDAVAIMRAMPNYTSTILPAFSNITVDASGNIAACNVFYAGGNGGVWTFGLWPHSSTISALPLSTGGKKITKYQVTNIGNSLAIDTFCHENGHMLCDFPDIYDYDPGPSGGYDSKGGAGNFCLMDYGGPGNNPVQICAYLKRAAGWATTVEMTFMSNISATLAATQGDPDFNRFYRYEKPGTPTEYYLFENRQKAGRDASLPSAGVAIWHIDEYGDRDNQSLAYNAWHLNYECTLVQADNLWHFQNNINAGDENDLYFLGNTATDYTGNFTDATTPSARWWDGTPSKMNARNFSASGPIMTFNLVPPPPVMLVTGALPPGRVGSFYSYALTAAGGELPYIWEWVTGPLPSGIVINSDGTITGMPEEATNAYFSAAVRGLNGVAVTNQFSLLIQPVFPAPFTETFESGGSMPDGWTQEQVSGELSWTFRAGSAEGHPPTAHGGAYNASLALVTYTQMVTRLVSPRIDFGTNSPAARLTFWHYMEKWSAGQDELRVYYRTDWTNSWLPLASYVTSTAPWTQRTIDLPDPGPTYYIAFEGTAKYGYGICVDDVAIFDPTPPLSITTESPLPEAITAQSYSLALTAQGGVTNYTFTLAAGGLPDHFSLAPDGVISGMSSNVQTATFTVLLTDGAGATSLKSFSLTVALPRADLFAEDFENGGAIPAGWTQQFVTNQIAWLFQGGGHNNLHPSTPQSGRYLAFLFSSAWVNGGSFDQKTRLISPMINLGQAPANARLTFWHYMENWQDGQDELRVFYRSSAGGAWMPLTNATTTATYTNNTPTWTRRSLPLPNPTSTYWIAFEGNARFGYGVCIDNVRISDSADAPIIQTGQVLPMGVTGMAYGTALAAAGGTLPYAWSVVSNSLPQGLSLGSDGVISGTPEAAALAYFRVSVRGDDGKASTNLFSLRIMIPGPVPFTERFESGSMPQGWTQESLSALAPSWTFRSGSPVASGIPSAPHGGSTNNACLYVPSASTLKTRLITPTLNLGVSTTNTLLTFWHCMANNYGYQDKLRVYYRTSAASEWVELARYEANVPVWTQRTVALPNPSTTYSIAFEGWGNYGYGICIDDVIVSGDFSASPYTVWKNSGFFTADELRDGFVTGDLNDPDNDGIVNALEYAMGLDPRVAETNGLPVGGVVSNYLNYTYRKNMSATDVRYEVVASTSLVVSASAWTTNGVNSLAPYMGSNTWWSVTSWHDEPVTNAPQRFMRLRVTMP